MSIQQIRQAANKAVHKWVYDGGMIDEILKEVATLEDIEDSRNECLLMWTHGIQVQRAQNQH